MNRRPRLAFAGVGLVLALVAVGCTRDVDRRDAAAASVADLSQPSLDDGSPANRVLGESEDGATPASTYPVEVLFDPPATNEDLASASTARALVVAVDGTV